MISSQTQKEENDSKCFETFGKGTVERTDEDVPELIWSCGGRRTLIICLWLSER